VTASQTDVAEAIVPLLNVSPSCNAMKLSDAKTTRPSDDYCEVSVSPVNAGARRMSGTVNLVGGSWRVDVRACGISEGNASTLMSRVRSRLDVKPVTVGTFTGHMVFESGDSVAENPDDLGWWTSLLTFTLTL
jgi:hypothetical protein